MTLSFHHGIILNFEGSNDPATKKYLGTYAKHTTGKG